MKHAYLIMAHNEFRILDRLLEAIDDERNDIYIHWDRKLSVCPTIRTGKARVFVLTERVDVRWGGLSLVKAEYALFEAAFLHGGYDYYHLLSGVDMPLKSQNYIHHFFSINKGKELIGYSGGDIEDMIDIRVRRYHLFPRYFMKNDNWRFFFVKVIRALYLRLQNLFGIQRHRSVVFKKGTNWVSVTDAFVRYLIQQKNTVLDMYHYTFCSDEIFIQTLCWNSPFRKNLFDPENESYGCMRKIGWKGNQLIEWEEKDYDELMESFALFARKFTEKHMEVVDRILETIKQDRHDGD